MDNIKTVSAFFVELALRGVIVEIKRDELDAKERLHANIVVIFTKGCDERDFHQRAVITYEDYIDEEKLLEILKFLYETFIKECRKRDVPIY